MSHQVAKHSETIRLERISQILLHHFTTDVSPSVISQRQAGDELLVGYVRLDRPLLFRRKELSRPTRPGEGRCWAELQVDPHGSITMVTTKWLMMVNDGKLLWLMMVNDGKLW